MKTMELDLRSAQTDDEVRCANDLMAKVHNVDYFNTLDWLQTAGASYPGFHREHLRMAFWGGELAGALRINMETIRLGEARLKMGGFGWVTTAPRHRNKGVARALMLDSMRYLREQQCHVSMLFGIPNFYHRFGFATTISDYATVVRVPAVADVDHTCYRMRLGKPGDIGAIQRMHNANDTEVACSIVRSSAHITNQWERWKDVRVLTDKEGTLIAYFLARVAADELLVDESGVTSRDAALAVLHASGALAREACVPRIRLHMPPPHPLTRHLLEYQSVHEMRVDRNGSGMMAFVCLDEALESLLPEWEGRLQQHAAREHRTEVTLLVDNAPYRVRANRGALDIANTPGKNKFSVSANELMHLVTGYRFLDDVYHLQRRIITAEARELLTVLFPKRYPFVWPVDRF